MHCILCIVLYALYYMHCIICIILYALYIMHSNLCIVFFSLYSMHCQGSQKYYIYIDLYTGSNHTIYKLEEYTIFLRKIRSTILAWENNCVFYNLTKIVCYMTKLSTIFSLIGTVYFSGVNRGFRPDGVSDTRAPSENIWRWLWVVGWMSNRFSMRADDGNVDPHQHELKY